MVKSFNRPSVVDLFSGAGGLSLGFEQAGCDVVVAIEKDPIHAAVHEYNFPNCKTICCDIQNVTGKMIKDASGRQNIDIVVGGAPCQGFSLIGKRSLDDPRNSLVGEYLRIVKELSPKYFVFENVKGITLGEHKRFLDELIFQATKLGYEISLPYKVLNAKDYGVPQFRERLFLLGSKKSLDIIKYPHPCSNTTVYEAIGDLPNADMFKELLDSDSVEVSIKPKSRYAKILRGLIQDDEDFSFPRKWNSRVLTSSNRTIHTPESIARFGNTKPGDVESVSRFKRLDPHGLCNTLRAGTDSSRGAHTSPRPIHPEYARVITVREAARLHSYPDWFRFHVTKWHGFRQIGNSVPPLLARAIASQIVKSMGVIIKHPTSLQLLENEFLLKMNMSEASAYYSVSTEVIPQRKRKQSKLSLDLEYAGK